MTINPSLPHFLNHDKDGLISGTGVQLKKTQFQVDCGKSIRKPQIFDLTVWKSVSSCKFKKSDKSSNQTIYEPISTEDITKYEIITSPIPIGISINYNTGKLVVPNSNQLLLTIRCSNPVSYKDDELLSDVVGNTRELQTACSFSSASQSHSFYYAFKQLGFYISTQKGTLTVDTPLEWGISLDSTLSKIHGYYMGVEGNLPNIGASSFLDRRLTLTVSGLPCELSERFIPRVSEDISLIDGALVYIFQEKPSGTIYNEEEFKLGNPIAQKAVSTLSLQNQNAFSSIFEDAFVPALFNGFKLIIQTYYKISGVSEITTRFNCSGCMGEMQHYYRQNIQTSTETRSQSARNAEFNDFSTLTSANVPASTYFGVQLNLAYGVNTGETILDYFYNNAATAMKHPQQGLAEYPVQNAVYLVGKTIKTLDLIYGYSFSDKPTLFTISRQLPSGLSFSTETGQISGTPTVVTPYNVYDISFTLPGYRLPENKQVIRFGLRTVLGPYDSVYRHFFDEPLNITARYLQSEYPGITYELTKTYEGVVIENPMTGGIYVSVKTPLKQTITVRVKGMVSIEYSFTLDSYSKKNNHM